MVNKDEILAYIRKTPANTNVNVLGTMLGDTGGGTLPEVTSDDNGKVLAVVDGTWNKAENDKGYECVTSEIFDGSITTAEQSGMNVGMQAVSFILDQPTLKITFNGTEYECERQSNPYGGAGYVYGAPMGQTGYDFSEYPFVVGAAEEEGQKILMFATQNAGTYTLNIGAEDVEASECFEKAVKQFSRCLAKFVTSGGTLVNVMMVDRGTVLEASDLPTPPSGTAWLNVPTEPITSDITIQCSNPVG